jgi:hypothetical protein
MAVQDGRAFVYNWGRCIMSRPPGGTDQLNGDVDDILELMIEEGTACLRGQRKPQKEERMGYPKSGKSIAAGQERQR